MPPGWSSSQQVALLSPLPFDLLPYFLPTLCFSHSGILTAPETHQAHCCLGGFAQAAPCQGVPLSSAGRDPFQTSPRPPVAPRPRSPFYSLHNLSSAHSNLVLVYSYPVVS